MAHSGKPITETSDGIPGKRPSSPHQSVVTQQLSVNSKNKELVLQTPFGSFHRQAMSSLPLPADHPPVANLQSDLHPAGGSLADNPAAVMGHEGTHQKTSEKCPLMNVHTDSSLSNNPEDFIDADLHHSKLTCHRMTGKMDVRRLVMDPTIPDVYRKRLLDGTEPVPSDGARKRPAESMDCETDPKVCIRLLIVDVFMINYWQYIFL